MYMFFFIIALLKLANSKSSGLKERYSTGRSQWLKDVAGIVIFIRSLISVIILTVDLKILTFPPDLPLKPLWV